MFIILNRNGLAISISEWRSRLEWVYQTRWFRVTISIGCQCSVNFVSHSDLNFIERGFFPSLSIRKTLYWSSVIHSSSESVAGSQKSVTNGTDWTQHQFLYKSFIGIINFFFSQKTKARRWSFKKDNRTLWNQCFWCNGLPEEHRSNWILESMPTVPLKLRKTCSS